MFKRGCDGCGEFWYIGNDSTCKCADETPKREWVGLTDEEIAKGAKESWVDEQAFQSAVWWAESKLKERNNG